MWKGIATYYLVVSTPVIEFPERMTQHRYRMRDNSECIRKNYKKTINQVDRYKGMQGWKMKYIQTLSKETNQVIKNHI